MKIKHLLTLLLTMATLPALAQGSGIKGKVVSRGDRAAIEQVKITLTPGERQATSDAEGRFRFDDVASGDYTLTFEADDYEPLEIKVRVDKLTKDVRSIALVPVYTEAFDDSIFAEFDTETANDTQSLPSSLSSSKDVFNNIASYPEGSSLKILVVPYILDINKLSYAIIPVLLHSRTKRNNHVLIINRRT